MSQYAILGTLILKLKIQKAQDWCRGCFSAVRTGIKSKMAVQRRLLGRRTTNPDAAIF
jgi:hypothetical protein